MTLELNIAAARLDGYRVETLDNRLFYLVRDSWRRGPYTSERDAWKHGGVPDYSGSKIEALAFARRVGFDASGIGTSAEIVQAAIAFCTPMTVAPGIDGEQPVIIDAPEFETTSTGAVDVDEVAPPKRKRSSKPKAGNGEA